MGFRPSGTVGSRPIHYYGRRHDYIYYPVAWTDSSTGASYREGYYDEEGNRYDNVAFEKNGKYENVVCHCDYCGLDTVMDLSSDDFADRTLQCPGCGAPIAVKSFLDQEVNAAYTESSPDPDYAETERRRSRRTWLAVLLAIFVMLVIYQTFVRSRANQSPFGDSVTYTYTDSGDGQYSGDTLYLSRTGENEYSVVSGAADKTLTLDGEDYYDAESGCWLWYNTDVEPPVWQYWYEGISSDFGDYGWMEYDEHEGRWYIEAARDEWIELPGGYDASALWHIAE